MKTRKLQRLGVPIICLVALLATALVNGLAQDRGSGTKRSLNHQDYDSWRSIQAPQISRDGKFIAYAFMAQDGDSEIVVRNRATGTEWRAPRGYRPPTPPPDDSIPNVAEIIAAQAHLLADESMETISPSNDGRYAIGSDNRAYRITS